MPEKKKKKFAVTFTFRPAAILQPRQLPVLDRVDILTLMVKADSSWAALDDAVKLLWKRHVKTTEYFGDLLAIQIQQK